MSLLDSLKADAQAVLTALKGVFTSLKSELTAFLSQGASAIATTIATQLPQDEAGIVSFLESSAMDAVTAAEVVPGGGEAKMIAALAAFTADLATKGVTLAETEMRALLENTLLVFKAQQSAATGTPSPAPASSGSGSAS